MKMNFSHPHLLSQGARWMSGPSFLRESEERWPKPSPSDRDSPHSAEEEMQCEFTLVSLYHCIIIDWWGPQSGSSRSYDGAVD